MRFSPLERDGSLSTGPPEDGPIDKLKCATEYCPRSSMA
jgi:hypothetical protein